LDFSKKCGLQDRRRRKDDELNTDQRSTYAKRKMGAIWCRERTYASRVRGGGDLVDGKRAASNSTIVRRRVWFRANKKKKTAKDQKRQIGDTGG